VSESIDEPFDGRVALVTGANRGIGFAIASELCSLGTHVLVGARSADRAESAVRDLLDAGGSAEPFVIDIDSDASVESASDRLDQVGRGLDILINNAAIKLEYHPSPPSQLPVSDVRDTLETNVVGTIRAIQAFLPILTKSNRPRIINMSSGLGSLTHATDIGGRYQIRPLLSYSTSKAAVNMVTVLFANEFRETPLRVNAVDPGAVNTPMTRGLATRVPEQGAKPVFDCLRMPNDGPTGGFFDESGVVPW
jgi:NAD(P)-dependent dehydrogenase (short-subunit alcohol dehydrogenase family)